MLGASPGSVKMFLFVPAINYGKPLLQVSSLALLCEICSNVGTGQNYACDYFQLPKLPTETDRGAAHIYSSNDIEGGGNDPLYTIVFGKVKSSIFALFPKQTEHMNIHCISKPLICLNLVAKYEGVIEISRARH